ncbi:MAG: S1 family peptidase [Deltaproteobacteria bacterium]|nr:S1 family peptidase [Deltaproteobacteria bacterium]
MYKPTMLLLLIMSVIVAFRVQAEHHALTIAGQLSAQAMGVVGGTRAEGDDFRGTVMLTARLPNGKEKLCSGFLVEGCIVSASHCIPPNSTVRVWTGTIPTTSTTDILEYRKWDQEMKAPGNLQFDLAVLKPNLPPPNDFCSHRRDIATGPLLSDIDRPYIAGYGLYNTVESENGKKHNEGTGVKRWGQSLVKGRKGRLILTERSPNVIAQGDSGGPLVMPDGTIYGVNISALAEYALKPNEATPVAGRELLVENITEGRHLFLGDPQARPWLMSKLDELQCRDNTMDQMNAALTDEVNRHFRQTSFLQDWAFNKPGERVLVSMGAKLRRLLNLPPKEELWINPVRYSDGFVFEVWTGSVYLPKDKWEIKVASDKTTLKVQQPEYQRHEVRKSILDAYGKQSSSGLGANQPPTR